MQVMENLYSEAFIHTCSLKIYIRSVDTCIQQRSLFNHSDINETIGIGKKALELRR